MWSKPGHAFWVGYVHPTREIVRQKSEIVFHVVQRSDGFVSAPIRVLPADIRAWEVAQTLSPGDLVGVGGEVRERRGWHATRIFRHIGGAL
jgi:hypothetical protein